MKANFFCITLIAVVLFVMPSNTFKGNSINFDQCGYNNVTYAAGEKLVYKLYYNYGLLWIPAGEAIFTVEESKDAYELKATGKTYKSYESIFKVNDYFYSKVDKKSSLPKNFVRIVEEGNYRLYDSVFFDQDKKLAITYHGKSKSQTNRQLHKYQNCMQDMMSNLYNMRNINVENMKKGDNISSQMFFDKEVFPINISYGGKEVKDIKGLGNFKTLRLVPNLLEGNVFKKGDHMTIWVSDDDNKIPLLIESPVSVGSIKAVLKSHAGLRYKLNAQL